MAQNIIEIVNYAQFVFHLVLIGPASVKTVVTSVEPRSVGCVSIAVTDTFSMTLMRRSTEFSDNSNDIKSFLDNLGYSVSFVTFIFLF